MKTPEIIMASPAGGGSSGGSSSVGQYGLFPGDAPF